MGQGYTNPEYRVGWEVGFRVTHILGIGWGAGDGRGGYKACATPNCFSDALH